MVVSSREGWVSSFEVPSRPDRPHLSSDNPDGSEIKPASRSYARYGRRVLFHQNKHGPTSGLRLKAPTSKDHYQHCEWQHRSPFHSGRRNTHWQCLRQSCRCDLPRHPRSGWLYWPEFPAPMPNCDRLQSTFARHCAISTPSLKHPPCAHVFSPAPSALGPLRRVIPFSSKTHT